MTILLGTTNPSKVKRFSDLLKGYDVEFVTLKDLAITDEPEENGTTPEENAIAKAKFYGQYFEVGDDFRHSRAQGRIFDRSVSERADDWLCHGFKRGKSHQIPA